jgi:HEAT repeat protein
MGANCVPFLIDIIRSGDSKRSRLIISLTQRWPFLSAYFPNRYLVPLEAYAAFRALGTNGQAAVSDLAEMAQDTNREGSGKFAACSLGVIGPNGIRSLIKMLDDPSAIIRRRGAAGLCAAGHAGKVAVRPLIKASYDSDAEVRTAAVQALGLVAADPVEVLPTLCARLQDKDAQVRLWAAGSLQWYGPRATNGIRPLLSTLSDPDPDVRRQVEYALEEIAPGILPRQAQTAAQ